MKRNIAYIVVGAIILIIVLSIVVILGKNTSNAPTNSVTTPNQDNQNGVIDEDESEEEPMSTFDDERETLKREVEAIIGKELNLRGDAFTWTDNTTAMEVLQTNERFTPTEAASIQSKMVDYLRNIEAIVQTEASFQNPEKADGNIIYAAKFDVKFKVGFIGVGEDGAFYIAYAGL